MGEFGDGFDTKTGAALGKNYLKNHGVPTPNIVVNPAEQKALPSGIVAAIEGTPELGTKAVEVPVPQDMENGVETLPILVSVGDEVWTGNTQITIKGSIVSQETDLQPLPTADKHPTLMTIPSLMNPDQFVTVGYERIEEVDIKMGRGVPYARQVLLTLVQVENKVLGVDETASTLKTYTQAFKDYTKLCTEAGISIDLSMKQWDVGQQKIAQDGTISSLTDQLKKTENQFMNILSQPVNLLEFMYSSKPEEYKKFVVAKLGLDPENYTRTDVLNKLLTTEDTRSVLRDILGDNPTSIDRVEDNIMHAKLLGLALYPTSAWREFTKIMLQGNTESNGEYNAQLSASRFSAEGAVKVQPDAFNIQTVSKKLESILKRGVSYTYQTKRIQERDGVKKLVLTEVPAVVPLSMYRDKDGVLQTTYPPRVYVETVPQTNGTEKKQLFQRIAKLFTQETPAPVNAERANATAVVQLVEKDEDGPGSKAAFLNSKEHILGKTQMMQEKVPMIVRLTKYKNGELYITGVSDHTLTDGMPLSNDVIASLVENMGWTLLPNIEGRKSAETPTQMQNRLSQLLPDIQLTKDLPKFSELSGLFPAESLEEFRSFISESRRKNVSIVDEKGQAVDPTVFGLGTLLSLSYGHMITDVAYEQKIIKNKSLGSLAARKELNEQLMQVNITDFSLPEDMSQWFRIEDRKIVFTQTVADTLREASNVFRNIGTSDDSMQTVREVQKGPKLMWYLNAFASKHIFTRYARATVGDATVSVLNTRADVDGGPALVPQWTKIAATFSKARNGLIPFKVKMEDPQKAPSFFASMLEKTNTFDQKSRQYLQKQKLLFEQAA